jgi:signal transduction histidine kinase
VLTFFNVTIEQEAIDARMRAHQALVTIEDRLRFALESAPIAVISHDGELRPIWVFVHGHERPESSRQPADLFVPGDAERYTQIVHDVYKSGVGQRTELEVVIAGEARGYDFRIEPSKQGGVTSVGYDVTSTKTALVALRDADRRKDEFLATLSHELRNPMTPLRVAFDVARLAKADREQVGKAMDIIDRQLQVLLRLTDDLLDVSRITQGKIQLQRSDVDATRVAELALETARPLIEEAKQTLHVELAPGEHQIHCDAVRLAQAVTNLLTNASRYTQEGGDIWLEVTPDPLRERLAIKVRDNGQGIDPEILPRIFEMYFQSREALGKSHRGLGLGLHLVKRLVDLHDGTVTARSDGVGRGSEFVVDLPLVRNRT